MIPTPYEQDLASRASPLRFAWPAQLSHGSSPLARQERAAESSSSSCSKPAKLPPFSDVFDAAAEPPPPYTELPRVPFASFYALAYDRSESFQHHVIDIPELEGTNDLDTDVEMDSEDEIECLGRLVIDLALDVEECSSPVSSPSRQSFNDSKLGPWRTPSQRHRRSLIRRRQNPAGQRALEAHRMNFIIQNIPHLEVGLMEFEDRAGTPALDVFYDWYDTLAADQRVKFMPWFVPSRLDLVRAPTPAPAVAPKPEVLPRFQPLKKQLEKSQIRRSVLERNDASASIVTAALEDAKRKEREAMARSPPRTVGTLPGWEDMDQAVRLLRILPNRQRKELLRKEATIRSWKSAVSNLGRAQWDIQLMHCESWRKLHQDRIEAESKEQAVTFNGRRYSTLIFPSSFKPAATLTSQSSVDIQIDL